VPLIKLGAQLYNRDVLVSGGRWRTFGERDAPVFFLVDLSASRATIGLINIDKKFNGYDSTSPSTKSLTGTLYTSSIFCLLVRAGEATCLPESLCNNVIFFAAIPTSAQSWGNLGEEICQEELTETGLEKGDQPLEKCRYSLSSWQPGSDACSQRKNLKIK
jgi:hypothetical protein